MARQFQSFLHTPQKANLLQATASQLDFLRVTVFPTYPQALTALLRVTTMEAVTAAALALARQTVEEATALRHHLVTTTHLRVAPVTPTMDLTMLVMEAAQTMTLLPHKEAQATAVEIHRMEVTGAQTHHHTSTPMQASRHSRRLKAI